MICIIYKNTQELYNCFYREKKTLLYKNSFKIKDNSLLFSFKNLHVHRTRKYIKHTHEHIYYFTRKFLYTPRSNYKNILPVAFNYNQYTPHTQQHSSPLKN